MILPVTKGPLSGIRVLDFGHYLAGPGTAMMLADQGADVIHIERPGGPSMPGPTNAILNRGKRITTLDLKAPQDVAIARTLIAGADVVIENFRPGVMSRLGLGSEDARRQHPGLIYLSLPGFSSEDDAFAGLPGWEGVISAAMGQFTDMGLNRVLMGIPQFDLNIPDQFRVDLWVQDFKKDLAEDKVPALSILWIMDDHTGGPPTVHAQQADNDLAVGRIIDYISHSGIWESSAIFIEEDDAQNGVDDVDGHRSPGYVVSPYAVQNKGADHTYYTQVNMTRTIEQILGLPPMNQFDLVASPMRTAFVQDKKEANFEPYTHVLNQVPLDQGVTTAMAKPSGKAGELAKAWADAKLRIFAGKSTKPDAEDPYTVNHFAWYEATGFTRPYPGEKKVRWPSEFASRIEHPSVDLDD